MQIRDHFVYYLSINNDVVYVGRSFNPKGRRRVFERTHGLKVDLEISKPLDLNSAQKLELLEIKIRKPKYNKVVASSPTRLGMQNTKEHNKAITKSLAGRKLSEEHKKKLWEERDRTNIKGTPHTEKTKILLRERTKEQFDDPEKRERHKLAMQKWGKEYAKKTRRARSIIGYVTRRGRSYVEPTFQSNARITCRNSKRK